MTLAGSANVSGNGFGGIEVAKSKELPKNSALTIGGTIVNSTEAVDKPTVWVIKDQGSIKNATEFKTKEVTGKTYYYLRTPIITISEITGTIAVGSPVTEDVNGLVTGFSKESGASISVSLTKGTLDYSNVRIVVKVKEMADGVQLLAEDTAGQWWNIAKSGWGPPEGFALADATTEVYPVVSKSGQYTVTVQLIDLNDSNMVLAEAQYTVNVPD